MTNSGSNARPEVGRIALLVRELNAANAASLRYDIDDECQEAKDAREVAYRIEEELAALRPSGAPDVIAALRVVRREFMKDRIGEMLGTVELLVINLLEGVEEFVLDQDEQLRTGGLHG